MTKVAVALLSIWLISSTLLAMKPDPASNAIREVNYLPHYRMWKLRGYSFESLNHSASFVRIEEWTNQCGCMHKCAFETSCKALLVRLAKPNFNCTFFSDETVIEGVKDAILYLKSEFDYEYHEQGKNFTDANTFCEEKDNDMKKENETANEGENKEKKCSLIKVGTLTELLIAVELIRRSEFEHMWVSLLKDSHKHKKCKFEPKSYKDSQDQPVSADLMTHFLNPICHWDGADVYELSEIAEEFRIKGRVGMQTYPFACQCTARP